MTKKLTNPMRKMLENLRDHGNLYFGLQGRSEMGGAVWTVQALRRRGYINEDWHMTPDGSAALSNGEHS